jgi:hypothetical protein
MFSKCIAKIFALEPAATAVECGVIGAILLTALVCLTLAVADPVFSADASSLGSTVVSAQ